MRFNSFDMFTVLSFNKVLKKRFKASEFAFWMTSYLLYVGWTFITAIFLWSITPPSVLKVLNRGSSKIQKCRCLIMFCLSIERRKSLLNIFHSFFFNSKYEFLTRISIEKKNTLNTFQQNVLVSTVNLMSDIFLWSEYVFVTEWIGRFSWMKNKCFAK